MVTGTQRLHEVRSALHAALEAYSCGDVDEMAGLIAAALSWLPSTRAVAA